jgi:hypothetical protein
MSPNNMDNENSDNQVIFYKKGHFWFDSGLVGLLILIRSIKHKIKIIFEGNKVILKGQKNDIQEALENAYMILRDRSYNISTQKQLLLSPLSFH